MFLPFHYSRLSKPYSLKVHCFSNFFKSMPLHYRSGNGHSSVPRHFFKVVNEQNIQEGKLKLPRRFAKVYGNALSGTVFLKVPNGDVWELELTKCDGRIWLHKGWQKFAEHYSLESGYFLVFRYEGNSHILVLIFDKSATEIEYPYFDKSMKIINDISPRKRQKPELQCSRPHKMMRSNHTDCRVKGLNFDERYKALQRVHSAFKTQNPYFLAVMQPAYVGLSSSRSFCLAIPKEFSSKYLMDHGDVILCDSKGKTWSAEYHFVRSRKRIPYAFLRNGWGTFVRDNNLHVGDICAFELIDCIKISFKVLIFRGEDVSSPSKRESGNPSAHQGHRKSWKACETAPQRRAKKACEKALQRAKAFTSENPFFLVVLQRSYVLGRPELRIPHEFSRKYFDSTLTRSDIALCLSNGKSWPAEFRRESNKRPYGKFCNGWMAFAKENKLVVGDVCVFEMTDDTKLTFKVFIFKAITEGNSQPSQGVSQVPLGLTSQSPKAAREKASVTPFFRRVVLPIHLKENRMDIPFKFTEKYFEPNIEKLELKVADRSWPVKVTTNPRSHLAKLTSGWIEFARENFLKEGDICVYEVDTVSNDSLKVSISKRPH